MKDTLFTQALKEVIAEDLKALDEVIEEDVEVLADVGSPEKLIGKPYFDPGYHRNWTEQDILSLYQIYGQGKIDDFIAKKEIEDLDRLKET